MARGCLVMAYGTPEREDDLLAYYTDIRRGRPPTDEQLADLRRRYDAIGGLSPLAVGELRHRPADTRREELHEDGVVAPPSHGPVRDRREGGFERRRGALVVLPGAEGRRVGSEHDAHDVVDATSGERGRAVLDLRRCVLEAPVSYTHLTLPTNREV